MYIKGNITLSIATIKNYKDIIGGIIHGYLENREFSLSDIRNSISKALGASIVGVKVENITSDNKEIVKVDSSDKNVFTLSKSLFIDDNNNLDLIYNIDLKMKTIFKIYTSLFRLVYINLFLRLL